MPWFFETEKEKALKAARRAQRREDKESERAAKYYAELIPKVLANCGVDHWVPRPDRPSVGESLITGAASRQKVEIIEVRWNAHAFYLWVDSRALPYRSDLDALHTDAILNTLSDACGRQVVWRSVPGFGSWYVIWRNGAINAIPAYFAYKDALAAIPQNAGPLSFIAGVTENDTLIRADITRMPHYLVAGSTNTGKSVHLNQLLCQLIARNTPDTLKFLMIDLKGGTEFAFYENLPHLWQTIITKPGEVPPALELFRDEMELRYSMIRSSGVKDINGYNDKHPDHKLPYIVLVFDEVALLLRNTDRKLASLAADILADILARARSAGMHCIICTQTPRSEVIQPFIKINCTCRICFAVPGNTDSIVVIDKGDAAGLEPAGRSIYSFGPKLTEIQSPFISNEHISTVVKEAIERAGGIAPKQDDHVTLDDLLGEAVNNYSGKLHRDRLFNSFKGRIARESIDQMINEVIGQTVVIDGRAYEVVMRGRGKHGGRFLKPVDGGPQPDTKPRLELIIAGIKPQPPHSILKAKPSAAARKAS